MSNGLLLTMASCSATASHYNFMASADPPCVLRTPHLTACKHIGLKRISTSIQKRCYYNQTPAPNGDIKCPAARSFLNGVGVSASSD